ncbi:hypothetical protein [Sphaerimonospora mesophila]|uniref:hypothetical protein n=1 Tax=Sphaerimonospora mesophila TaxID=37483 RepID=UPI000A6332F5
MILNSRKRIPRGVILATVVLAGTTIGGGSILSSANADDGSSATPLATFKPLENHSPNVRASLLALFSGASTRHAAVETLVQRCMAQKGFTYVKEPTPTEDVAPTLNQDPYGVTAEKAKRSGYNAAETLSDSPGETDRSGVTKLSSIEQKNWGEAYFGPDNAPEITATIPGYGEVGTPSEGCLSQAREEIYGPLKEWIKLDFLAGNLPLEARWKASADPEMKSINSAWSSCMAGKGYSGFKDPSQARIKAQEFHQRLGIGSDEARSKEVSLATADAECETATDYAPHRIKIEDKYYAQVLEARSADVTAIKEMNQRALSRAKEVLRTG